jgi:hypothetical protein
MQEVIVEYPLFILSNFLCDKSISTLFLFMRVIPFFLYTNQTAAGKYFCGLCPYPASGIEMGSSGNTANADGIRPERFC